MAWFKIDDGFWAHPKTLQLTDSAVALWVRAGAWSCQQLTDGFIPQYALPMLGVDESPAIQLVEVGYWDETPGGYTFHDWDEYQEASEAVKDRRKKNAEKMRRWRDAKAAKQGGDQGSNPVSDPVTLPVTNPVSNPLPDPTRPDPTSSSKEEGSASRGSRVPEPFIISDDMRSWAKGETPLVDLDKKTLEFVDYWAALPGQKGIKSDWLRTWKNGMRKQQEFAERDAAKRPPKPGRVIPANEEWMYR